MQGQTQRIDSLRHQLAGTLTIREQLDILQALCDESHSLNIDTLMHYALLFRQTALSSGEKEKMIIADVAIETWLGRKNQLDSALNLCTRDLNEISYSNAPEGYPRVRRQKCFLLMKTNKRQEALADTYRFLNEAELNQDTTSQIYGKYIIGCVYRSMQQTEQALQWFYKAATTGERSIYNKDKNEFAVFLQIGGMYNWKAVADVLQKDITTDSALSMFFWKRR